MRSKDALAPSLSSLACVSTKSERRAAREVVAAYHEAQLAELLRRVGETVDSFRARRGLRLGLFSHVTWPSLRSTRTFILITITIAAFSLFTQVSVMTQGGPLDSTTTVVFMAVRTGYEQQSTGYAAAVSLVFFAMVLTISLVQRFLTRDKD